MTKIRSRISIMGTAAAMIISWSLWKSFWWMILHGALGWIYIIYWAIKF